MYSKDVWTQLNDQCYTVYITSNKAYLLVSERQEINWGNKLLTTKRLNYTCLGYCKRFKSLFNDRINTKSYSSHSVN